MERRKASGRIFTGDYFLIPKIRMNASDASAAPKALEYRKGRIDIRLEGRMRYAGGRKALPAAEGGSFSQSISNCMKNVRRLQSVRGSGRPDHSEYAQAAIRQEAW